MRLFYAGDVHGSEKCWRKFLNAAKFYEVDTLIMGGDITGKVLVPIVSLGDGRHHASILGGEEIVDDAGLEGLQKRIRFNGFYPFPCDRDQYNLLGTDSSYRDATFTALMVAEVSRWVALAEERLAGSGVNCLVMPGNDDEFAVDQALESPLITNPDNRVVRIGEVQILSCSWTNPTPWASPREESEEALGDRLALLASDLEPGVPTIFNLHCPPYNTPLDRAPQLTADLKVVADGGQPRIISVGSRAVRELIEQYQPVLSLHGHIHESKGVTKIGRTTCVNPGSAYGEGVIDGVIVELQDNTVKSCQLVSG